MKGFLNEPFKGGTFNWQYARERVAEYDPNRCVGADNQVLQDIVMGPNIQPCAHVIVPTLLCVTIDEERTRALLTLWHQWFAKVEDRNAYLFVAQFRERFMRTCAFCKVPLEHRSFKKPYQLAIRFIVGYSCAFSPHTGLNFISHADVVFSVVCDSCCTVPMSALLMVTELDYPIIAHAIERLAFYQRVNMSRFTHYTRSSFHEALVQSIMWRCSLINEQRRVFLRLIMKVHALDVTRCSGCLEYAEHVYLCNSCKAVYFCETCIADRERLLAHATACYCIIKQYLFHTQCGVYVNQKSGRYECIQTDHLLPLTTQVKKRHSARHP